MRRSVNAQRAGLHTGLPYGNLPGVGLGRASQGMPWPHGDNRLENIPGVFGSLESWLLEWLLECCGVAGIACIDLELRAGNHAAHRLYRKLGFEETSRVAGYYGGRETAIRMLKVLRTPSRLPEPWRPPTLDKR